MNVTIYSDGACSGNPGPGGYGCIILFQDNIFEYSAGELNTTNNRMEMISAIIGIEIITQYCKDNKIPTTDINLKICSDSMLIISTFNKHWINKWQKNNWRSIKGEVKNKDLWLRFLQALKPFKDTIFKHVKGHSGHALNNKADWLAKMGIPQRR